MGLSRELRDVTAATRRNGSSLTAKASERSKNVMIFGHFVARLGEIGPPVILGNQKAACADVVANGKVDIEGAS